MEAYGFFDRRVRGWSACSSVGKAAIRLADRADDRSQLIVAVLAESEWLLWSNCRPWVAVADDFACFVFKAGPPLKDRRHNRLKWLMGLQSSLAVRGIAVPVPRFSSLFRHAYGVQWRYHLAAAS